MPSGERWLWAQVEDKFGMRNSSFIGTVMLEEKQLDLSIVREGSQEVQSFLLKGDTLATISQVTLTAYAMKELYMQGKVTPTELDFAKEELL